MAALPRCRGARATGMAPSAEGPLRARWRLTTPPQTRYIRALCWWC